MAIGDFVKWYFFSFKVLGDKYLNGSSYQSFRNKNVYEMGDGLNRHVGINEYRFFLKSWYIRVPSCWEEMRTYRKGSDLTSFIFMENWIWRDNVKIAQERFQREEFMKPNHKGIINKLKPTLKF